MLDYRGDAGPAARVLEWILDAVFPARCIVCSRRDAALCDRCRTELPYLPNGVCQRCASQRGPRGVCYSCRRLSAAVSSIRAPFVYEGAARAAVLTLKFRSGRYLIQTMGELLRAELARRPLHADVVVPVPLAPGRLRQRGFNQAELLANQVAATVGGQLLTGALARRERQAQQTLGAKARLSNLRDAVCCIRPEAVRGKRVLLVDDVVTTGATVSACADTLAEAGASRVSVLAFARDL